MSDGIVTTSSARRSLVLLGRRIAQSLSPAENAIDHAIADGAALLSTVARAQAESGLDAQTAHAPILTILRGLNALTDARAEFCLGHAQLTAIRNNHRMNGTEVGCSASKRVSDAMIAAS